MIASYLTNWWETFLAACFQLWNGGPHWGLINPRFG